MTTRWNTVHKSLHKSFSFSLTILTTLIVLLPLPADALPEQELASAFESQVRPFFAEQFIFDSFQGAGSVTLRYAKRKLSNPLGSLVLVIGRTEFLSKYAELLYDLRDLPFSTYLYDPRGQGASDRLLPEHDKGHVDNFDDYVVDLSVFITNVVTPADNPKPTGAAQNKKLPLFLLTHSMGGTVAALYANSHPDMTQGLILCAPMLAINTNPFPVPVARLLARTASLIGYDTSYVPGGGPYDPSKTFRNNKVTHSQTRFELNQTLVASSPVNTIGSPTYGWINQAFSSMQRLKKNHRQLTMPILLLQAGDDTVVGNRPQSDFCADLPTCTLVNLPGARHEILMEEDKLRNQAISLIRNFLTHHTPTRHQQLSHLPPAKESLP